MTFFLSLPRSAHLPVAFAKFEGYNDWKKKKMKKPRLSLELLQHHESKLSSLLSQPWLARSVFAAVRKDVEDLLEAIHHYVMYLQQHTASMQQLHHQCEPPRTLDSNVCMYSLPASKCCSSTYTEITDALTAKPEYSPLCLNDFAPVNRYIRRHWLDKLALPYRVMVMKYPHGNCLGTLCFIWKITEQIDETRNASVVLQLSQEVHKFSTREMRREFTGKYHHVASISKSILRSIYRDLTDDSSASESMLQREVDERVAKAVLAVESPDIMLDLRKLNGKPKSTHFDVFWEELSKFLEEINPAVDDRRHGETLHMPIAVSIRHLREVIIERLMQRFPGQEKNIPSEEWIRLQFWPKNPFSCSALRHTGRFGVKFSVQIRQLRKDHPDAKYCSVILKYARSFACQHADIVTYLSVDDKAIVPVGEPECPIAASSRSHNRSLVLSSASLKALDHDFHIHGVVPSVAFAVNIPESVHDSFYSGRAFVTLKDKVLQPSSALRHAAEQCRILSSNFPDSPVVVIVSDGGPDHRLTFYSVQVSLLCVFLQLDLDMLVAVRTCPYQSWQNIAERVMSTLNLGLQNVALCRKAMPEEFEKMVANKLTLTDLRREVTRNPSLQPQLMDSMAQPIVQLSQRFVAMKIKEDRVAMSEPAKVEEITAVFDKIHDIDSSVVATKLRKEDLKDKKPLLDFMKTHCIQSPYVFQVKKCLESSCSYCKEHPVRVTPEQFSLLHYLPLPLLDSSKTSYQSFEGLYGKEPSDSDRPSSKPSSNAEAAEVDKNNKAVLKSTKVRKVIPCGECGKPRCIYAASRLTREQEVIVNQVVESNIYTCGSIIFPPSSPFCDMIVVKQNISCADPMEASYYSAALVKFPAVCFYCGMNQQSLVSEGVAELKRKYGVVRPLCCTCQSEGKAHRVTHPNNVNANKRRRIE